jgi:hypothetical protein
MYPTTLGCPKKKRHPKRYYLLKVYNFIATTNSEGKQVYSKDAQEFWIRQI